MRFIMILKKEMRLSLASALLALTLFASPVSAFADEADNGPTEVDPFTGETINNNSETGPVIENEVRISEKGVYSREMERFIYDADSGKIYSNIASGMIVKDEVKIEVSEGIDVVVYKDGKELDKSGSYTLEDQGEYSVTTQGKSVDLPIMHFTIVKSETNRLFRYDMPDKFYISGIKFNDEEINFNRQAAPMGEDGHYVISYGCPSIMKYYTLDVVVDHTAPEPSFKGIKKNYTARGPVTISNIADDETLTITLDGKTLKEKQYKKNKQIKLKSSGRYVVTVTDRAGNEKVTNIRILTYINLTSTIFIIAFLTVFGGLVAYLIFHRKTFKVR